MMRSIATLTLTLLLILPNGLPAAETASSGAAMVQARTVVTERLASLGLTSEQALERAALLSDQEILDLAAQPDTLQMGGVHRETAMVMVTIIMVVGIVAVVSLV